MQKRPGFTGVFCCAFRLNSSAESFSVRKARINSPMQKTSKPNTGIGNGIDPLTEPLMPVAVACRLPWLRGRQGKKPHPSSLLRWILRGRQGVRLEAMNMSGQWCTSEQALVRFFRRLTAAECPGQAVADSTDFTDEHERATRRLAAAGIA